MRIPIGCVRKQAFVFVIGDIDAARKAYPTVTHHDLAVCAQIEHGTQKQIERIDVKKKKKRQLSTCRDKSLPHGLAGTPRKTR